MPLDITDLDKDKLFFKLFNYIQLKTSFGNPDKVLKTVEEGRKLLEANRFDYFQFNLFCDLKQNEVNTETFDAIYGSGIFKGIVDELRQEQTLSAGSQNKGLEVKQRNEAVQQQKVAGASASDPLIFTGFSKAPAQSATAFPPSATTIPFYPEPAAGPMASVGPMASATPATAMAPDAGPQASAPAASAIDYKKRSELIVAFLNETHNPFIDEDSQELVSFRWHFRHNVKDYGWGLGDPLNTNGQNNPNAIHFTFPLYMYKDGGILTELVDHIYIRDRLRFYSSPGTAYPSNGMWHAAPSYHGIFDRSFRLEFENYLLSNERTCLKESPTDTHYPLYHTVITDEKCLKKLHSLAQYYFKEIKPELDRQKAVALKRRAFTRY